MTLQLVKCVILATFCNTFDVGECLAHRVTNAQQAVRLVDELASASAWFMRLAALEMLLTFASMINISFHAGAHAGSRRP